jgi:predicted pyridoxine 5'-phosphate oxidase superfamily flavin-nucleotide-binding protein
MSGIPSDIAFTPAVKAIQSAKGSRASYARLEHGDGWESKITPELAQYIGHLDMFYLGTASAAGQPYIQHRGGPPGFLKVLDPQTLGFADFLGNRQYITVGNLSENSKAIIYLMDYPNRQRIKIWGTAKVTEDDPALLERLHIEGYPAKVERAILFHVAAWDMNCHQHITPRYTERRLAPVIEKFQARIAELEAEVARLKAAAQ